MNRIRAFIRNLFSTASSASVDPETILQGTDNEPGIIAECERLKDWQESYTEDYTDFLTVYEGLSKYETASKSLTQLEPLLDQSDCFDEHVVDAAATLETDLQNVCEFIENRKEYNDAWLERMKQKHGMELNSHFENPDFEHTEQQFRAIFANDNFNRVNAAAGTGKTTTFGRRVHFILSEYDDVAASDLLAFTFTRNGRKEMQRELEETFDITGVDVRTINSYSKTVAEDQYTDLEFIVGEAKTTEIARIWRNIQCSEEFEETVEDVMSAWKAERYDPNDVDIVDGIYESHTKKSTVTIQGEDIELDDIPEEGVAHKAIARLLTALELEYDYQTHLEWAKSPSGGYVLDFELVEPIDGERVYIEYCISEETRDSRPHYRNIHSERPETVRRIFSSNPEQEYDPEGNTVIVLDGEEILDGRSDQLKWGHEQIESRVANAVQSALEGELRQLGVDVSTHLKRRNLKEYVYDRKILYHDVVDKIEEFITQARVREWDPDEAEREAKAYLDAEDEDIDGGVEEFVHLSIAAYRRFVDVFDNRSKTDFHGSVVLTRDLLREGEVEEDFLYSQIFVDEMQDLNQVQFELVKELAKQRPDVRTFGVGDDWQSIFGFQGARPDLFINFGSELGAGEYDDINVDPIEVFTDENPLLSDFEAFADTRLEDNYRCPEPVVDTSNAVIENNEVRTAKEPSGRLGGDLVRIHHLGCDTFGSKLDQSMERKIKSLIRESPYSPAETQVLLRQKDGDPSFYYPLKKALPGGVDIRTAHDSKGSEAEHVIIPKVVQNDGYPSIQGDKWVEPVKQPPEIYEEHGVSYQLEEERRLFYVALTRAKSRLDVLTVQGSESVFVDELPDELCEHLRPLSESELREIETERELRTTVSGRVATQYRDNYVVFDWDGHGLLDMNLYDATTAQRDQIQGFLNGDRRVTLENCGIQYREANWDDEKDDSLKLELQLDDRVTIIV